MHPVMHDANVAYQKKERKATRHLTRVLREATAALRHVS